MKLALQEKLKAAKDHVDNKLTLSEVAQKYKLDQARLKYYAKLYKSYLPLFIALNKFKESW